MISACGKRWWWEPASTLLGNRFCTEWRGLPQATLWTRGGRECKFGRVGIEGVDFGLWTQTVALMNRYLARAKVLESSDFSEKSTFPTTSVSTAVSLYF